MNLESLSQQYRLSRAVQRLRATDGGMGTARCTGRTPTTEGEQPTAFSGAVFRRGKLAALITDIVIIRRTRAG